MGYEQVSTDLKTQGYALLPGFIPRELTAECREYVDRTLAEPEGPWRKIREDVYRVTHPMVDPLLAKLAADERVLEVVTHCLRAERLRLRQQMFILTHPCGEPPPSRSDGWHVDTVFTPDQWHSSPAQFFLQLFYYCTPVAPGGAATMVVPGSHHLTYAAAGRYAETEESRKEFARDPIRLAGVDLSEGIEVPVDEGDLLLFNPMTVHSGSINVTEISRYIFHASFYDDSSERVRGLPPALRDEFPPEMWEAMPASLRDLLER